MADVALRFTTAGTTEAIQSLNQVAQSTQRFASTTQQTLTQARVATQSFNFVLFDMARIARATGGAAGKEFANSLEGAVIAVSTARGAVAAYRGVLQSHELILKSVTKATEIFNAVTTAALGPWGLLAIAVTAAAVALAIYLGQQQQANGVTQDAIRLHQSLAHAVATSGHVSEEEAKRIAVAVQTGSRAWAEQAARIAALRDRFAEEQANEGAAAAARERDIQQWLINSVPVLRGQQAMADRWVAIGKAAEEAARKQKQAGVDSEKALFDIGIQAKNTYTETQNAADDAAAVQAQSAEDAAMMAKNAWVESENAQVDATLDAQQRIHDTIAAGLVGILTGTSTFADLWTQVWAKAVGEIIMNIGLIQTATTFVTGIIGGILGLFGLQRGGSFIATRPTPLMVGEAGAERVTVSPLAGSPAAGGSGLTVNFNAPQFWDEYTFNNFARRVGRILVSGPVGRVG